MIGGRHRSNMDLVAQGVVNFASPLPGGMPASDPRVSRCARSTGPSSSVPPRRVDGALNRTRTHWGFPVVPRPPFATATADRETAPSDLAASRP